MKQIQVLRVEWVDISEIPGWHPGAMVTHPEAMKEHGYGLPEPLHCTDVGFKVKETKDNLYLSKTYAVGDDGVRWGGIVVIPRGCVKEIHVIDRIKTRD